MSLEIVIGPMFSGKTTYALSYIRRQRAINKNVIVIKPNIDMRFSTEDVIVTHNREQTPCMTWGVEKPLKVTPRMKDADCIVIEESQFLTNLRQFVEELLFGLKKNVLIVGLDGDFRQQKFGEILDCIPLATSVTKLNALCKKCNDGTLAPYTKRENYSSTEQIVIGGPERYESVCKKHLMHIN